MSQVRPLHMHLKLALNTNGMFLIALATASYLYTIQELQQYFQFQNLQFCTLS